MNYYSTRGAALGRFCDVLLQGLAPDGGLALPEQLKRFSREEILSWRPLPYAHLAYQIIAPYADDIPADDLLTLLENTYRPEIFHSEAITPLLPLNDDLALLQLSNGPSLAFKDMALQLLGNLFAYVLQRRSETLNILGATSGDTGSAAEYAVLGKANLNIFMLSPHGRMSPFQQAQMYSLDAPNVFNIAIRGVFDDCQDLVKALNNDAAFKAEYHLGAVNSINWARILAQTVYYFKAYLQQPREEISVIVPSGNFGNILSGYLAKLMGLPIRRLLVATNENDVLAEFFRSGIYRPRPGAEVLETSSPSMDIGKASNFERYLYLLAGGDSNKINQLWGQLERQGYFDLSDDPLWAAVQDSGFSAYRSNHRERLAEIRAAKAEWGRVIDPHTADGVSAWRNQLDQHGWIVLETALPAKFAKTVQEALGVEPGRPERFRGLEALPRKVTVLDNDADQLKAFIRTALQDKA